MNHGLAYWGRHPVQHSACRSSESIIWIVALLLAGVGACAGPEGVSTVAAPVPPSAACLVLDQDGNLDDIRALAVLQPHRQIVAVVGTDGIVSAGTAAATAAQFLGSNSDTTVVSGSGRIAGQAALPDWKWLPEARTAAERLPALFTKKEASALPVVDPGVAGIGAVVARAVRDCSTVGLIVTGPWSSFVAYYPSVARKLTFVVAQGRSPEDPDDPAWDRVNCNFDRRACERAIAALRSTPLFWVDLPAVGQPYFITPTLIEALANEGPGKRMKQAMQRDEQWRGQQIWDDGAALFVVEPAEFKLVGRHIEPIPKAATLLLHEARLMNGSSR